MNSRYLIKVLTTPACWLRNERTNKQVDYFINKCLDAGCEIRIGGTFTTELGGVRLWTSNFPYAYGSLYGDPYGSLPSRRTAFRLHDAVCNQVIKSLLK